MNLRQGPYQKHGKESRDEENRGVNPASGSPYKEVSRCEKHVKGKIYKSY